MGGRGGGVVAPILTGVAVGAAVFTGGASLAVAAGVGAATAGVAAASSVGSVPKAPWSAQPNPLLCFSQLIQLLKLPQQFFLQPVKQKRVRRLH